MKINRKPIKLKLGNDYVVWFGYKDNDKLRCKFIQVTKCGFNFLNLETNKCILKQHLYPSKCSNHKSGDWFWVNKYFNINSIYNHITFDEYIIMETSQNFYDTSLLHIRMFNTTLEEWFKDKYYNYKLLYPQK